DAGQPWHPASLTKLMTAYVAFAAIAAGRISLDTPITISRNAWNQAPSKSGLAVGSAVTLKDALYIMLVKSANDIAVAVAEAVSGSVPAFVAEMNAMARAMGLTATHFVNPHGLHAEQQVTSARDLAVLALYIRRDYPQYLPMFATEAVKLNGHLLETNNSLLEHFAGTTGMKTGYICASGLNIVATVERAGRRMLAVVLGGSSARERNELTAELLLRGLSGAVRGTGISVTQIANLDAEPVNMRPLICGKQAKAYVAEREAAFPLGLKGQPSYLTDRIEGSVYVATDLGILRDVPLPRRRPSHAPIATALAD
ncbi:MAG TPA: D-alanyl-D-alanine carboxypeptidase, partial [Alphaproteobacteria bacterium]|nr:D-alanyl-D-alanine carboxypeptidase [Alphaproteobacteria bacterium]